MHDSSTYCDTYYRRDPLEFNCLFMIDKTLLLFNHYVINIYYFIDVLHYRFSLVFYFICYLILSHYFVFFINLNNSTLSDYL